MEIISGIHRIDGIRGANCYLVITGSEMMIIDAGMPGNGKKIINYVRQLGKKPEDIKYLVFTHADIDHVGSAAEIKRITGARCAIHNGDAAILAGHRGFKSVHGPLGILFKLMSPLLRFHKLEPDIVLNGNSEIAGFRIIHTPGHTVGSICLYLPGQLIFVGDALRSDSKGNPKPLSTRFSMDVAQARKSSKAISQLEFDILLPGHGAPVIGQASARLKTMMVNTK